MYVYDKTFWKKIEQGIALKDMNNHIICLYTKEELNTLRESLPKHWKPWRIKKAVSFFVSNKLIDYYRRVLDSEVDPEKDHFILDSKKKNGLEVVTFMNQKGRKRKIVLLTLSIANHDTFINKCRGIKKKGNKKIVENTKTYYEYYFPVIEYGKDTQIAGINKVYKHIEQNKAYSLLQVALIAYEESKEK